jgi:metal-responsive CopG/Arc/MetJ family transcriptional regulator
MGERLVRIQFEIPEEKVREIERWMAEGGVKTRRDFFNNAISLLIWAMQERKKGRIIASVDENEKKYKEVLMPILENISRSKAEVD